jgi:hypothetical protein
MCKTPDISHVLRKNGYHEEEELDLPPQSDDNGNWEAPGDVFILESGPKEKDPWPIITLDSDTDTGEL